MSGLRLVAAAVFAGLALIAGALAVTGDRWAWARDEPTYAGYEPVLRTWIELGPLGNVQSVEQVEGPFYRVVYGDETAVCILVDVSTHYVRGGVDESGDRFWWTAGAGASDADGGDAGAC